MRLRPLLAAAAGLVLASVAGCSDAVTGSAEQGTASGSGTSAIAASVSSPLLDRLPANDSTLIDISLIDPVALTKVAQFRGYRSDDRGEGRPSSETAWLDQTAVTNPCGTVLDGDYKSLRRGNAGPSSSLVLGTKDKQGTVAVCGGAVPDPATLKSADARNGEVSDRTIGGIAGFTADDTWIGVDQAHSLTYLADVDEVPADLLQAAISGGPADAPLAKDSRVRSVLDAAPQAAMVEMGTALLDGNAASAPGPVRTAFEQAVAQGGYQQAPIPEFGGFAWTPGVRITGTITFVTSYGSPQEAGTVVKILNDVWARLAPSKFSGAVTVQHDATVITTLADVGPTEFKLQSGQLADYPGFFARS